MAEDVVSKYNVLVIGGSAGSLEVIMEFVPGLNSLRGLSIVIVVHRGQSGNNTFAGLLSAKTEVPVIEIEDKEPFQYGKIYIAPGDYHLLFEEDMTYSLDASEKINFSRPSIDVTMASAATRFGVRAAGILLSGANSDGTAGLEAIRNAGGLVAVQDPSTAMMPFMPEQARESLQIGKLLRPEEIADFINGL
jgi:two-component system chemotaxis response regulator CheB